MNTEHETVALHAEAAFDRIVVGVDGSDCSIAALRWAAREARLRAATAARRA